MENALGNRLSSFFYGNSFRIPLPALGMKLTGEHNSNLVTVYFADGDPKLTPNRPEKMNALTSAMYARMANALTSRSLTRVIGSS